MTHLAAGTSGAGEPAQGGEGNSCGNDNTEPEPLSAPQAVDIAATLAPSEAREQALDDSFEDMVARLLAKNVATYLATDEVETLLAIIAGPFLLLPLLERLAPAAADFLLQSQLPSVQWGWGDVVLLYGSLWLGGTFSCVYETVLKEAFEADSKFQGTYIIVLSRM